MPFACSPTPFATIRRFGTTGSILLALGGLGVGAQPVLQNPVSGVRFIGLFERTLAASATMVFVGLAILVLAWLLLGRVIFFGDDSRSRGNAHSSRRISSLSTLECSVSSAAAIPQSWLHITVIFWALPLLLAPPMFSQDVYSYLAHGMSAHLGNDPYTLGPADTLGYTNILVRSVPTIWQSTPSPYGPLFMIISRTIADVTGYHVVAAVLIHRSVAVIGFALSLWALPHLARRCGTAVNKALWLGALNPLIFLHLISGIHNDSLMVGLMMVGMEFGLRGIQRWPLDDSPHSLVPALWYLLFSIVLITAAAMVKLPAQLALGFIGIQWAATLASRHTSVVRQALSIVLAGGLFGAVSLLFIVLLNTLSGSGFRWIHTVGAATKILNWVSPPTMIARLSALLGTVLGVGIHTQPILDVTWSVAAIAASCAVSWLLFRTFQGRIHPIGGIGVAFALVLAFLPTIHTWYALWALIPLAAWVDKPGQRKALVVIVVVLSFMAYPSGGISLPFVIFYGLILGIVVALVMSLLIFGWTWLTAPWSSTVPAPPRTIETS